MAMSPLGSANLIHPGLRPNGSSNTASRYRLKLDRSNNAMHLSQVAGEETILLIGGGKIS